MGSAASQQVVSATAAGNHADAPSPIPVKKDEAAAPAAAAPAAAAAAAAPAPAAAPAAAAAAAPAPPAPPAPAAAPSLAAPAAGAVSPVAPRKGILKGESDTAADVRNHGRSLQRPSSSLITTAHAARSVESMPIMGVDRGSCGGSASRCGTQISRGLSCSDGGYQYVPPVIHNTLGRGSGRFKHGVPPQLRSGDEVIPIFVQTDGGELMCCYRIVSGDGRHWSFYNDTVMYDLDILYVFGGASTIEALGFTTMHERSDGRVEVHLVVHPGDTQKFVFGDVKRYEHEVQLKPVTRAFMEATVSACDAFLREERSGIHALLTTEGIKRCVDNVWDTTGDQLLGWCVEKNIPFIDIEFPPAVTSLVGRFSVADCMSHYGWCKPKNYLEPELARKAYILRSRPHPSSVGVSGLGGQGVVCALAVLAEVPDEVAMLFRHPGGPGATARESRVDATRVALCNNGWWISVIVDHYFPVLNMRLVGGKCIDNPAELWVSVVEKACAKLHGGYANLAGVDTLQALQVLTGYPTTRLDALMRDPNRHEELFDKMNRYSELGFIVILDKPHSSWSEGRFQRLGLRRGDAYAVLSMKFFRPLPTNRLSEKQRVYRLVRFRNAFGNSGDWIGDWGLHDSMWKTHPAIAAVCKHSEEKGDDGSVWMEWRDVTRCFQGCGVCFKHSSFYQYRVQGRFAKKGVPECVVKLEVTRRTFLLGVLQQEVQGEEVKLPILLQLSRGDGVDVRHSSANADGGGGLSEKSLEGNRKGLQVVVLNSTADSDAPSPTTVTFRASTQVSLIAELHPEHNPHYLIPRSASQEGAYVLGFFTSLPCGAEGGAGATSVHAKFVRLSSKAKVFANTLKFTVPSEKPVKCRYQFLSPSASPFTFPETHESKYVK